ncbi:hypothetical protein GQ457_01G018160 [Hibiscus cannabinus]
MIEEGLHFVRTRYLKGRVNDRGRVAFDVETEKIELGETVKPSLFQTGVLRSNYTSVGQYVYGLWLLGANFMLWVFLSNISINVMVKEFKKADMNNKSNGGGVKSNENPRVSKDPKSDGYEVKECTAKISGEDHKFSTTVSTWIGAIGTTTVDSTLFPTFAREFSDLVMSKVIRKALVVESKLSWMDVNELMESDTSLGSHDQNLG